MTKRFRAWRVMMALYLSVRETHIPCAWTCIGLEFSVLSGGPGAGTNPQPLKT